MSIVVESRISASGDDCHVYWSSVAWAFTAVATSQPVGYYNATNFKRGGAMLFQNICVPQGGEITTAYLELEAGGSLDVDTVNSVIIGQAADDPDPIASLADYQNRRGTVCDGVGDDNITTASVNWDAMDAQTDGEILQSPEIKTIIQEIVNRAGWVYGNSIMLFWDDHADRSTHVNNCQRSAKSYDQNADKGALLHIEYEAVEVWRYLVGDPEMAYRGTRYLLGDPQMQARAKQYFQGLVEMAYRGTSYMLGVPCMAYGGGRFLQGIITVVPRNPKPITGAWFQRLSSVKKEIS